MATRPARVTKSVSSRPPRPSGKGSNLVPKSRPKRPSGKGSNIPSKSSSVGDRATIPPKSGALGDKAVPPKRKRTVVRSKPGPRAY